MSSEMDNLRESATETIYLVPDREEGQLYYSWRDDPAPGLDMDPSESVEYLRKDVHDAIIAKQAIAARQGMDAAKKVAGSNLEQAKRLHAECNPRALESERAANAALTEQVAKLEAHIASLKDDIEIHRVAEETQIALRQKMEKERDALAAHVERLREATKFCNEHHYFAGWTELLDEDATASLARRDLIKRAEALEEVGHDEHAYKVDKPLLLRKAAYLRQRAQALK